MVSALIHSNKLPAISIRPLRGVPNHSSQLIKHHFIHKAPAPLFAGLE
jgi:hypothetical protein